MCVCVCVSGAGGDLVKVWVFSFQSLLHRKESECRERLVGATETTQTLWGTVSTGKPQLEKLKCLEVFSHK